MKIIIGVVTHKKEQVPYHNSVFIPIGVGNAAKFHNVNDLNSGYNNYNKYYSEISGLAAINQLSNEYDYIGLCHYRRYYMLDNLKYKKSVNYTKFILSRFFGNLLKPGNFRVFGNSFELPKKNNHKAIRDFELFVKNKLKDKKIEAIYPYPIKFSNRRIREIFEKLSFKYIDTLEKIIIDYYPEYTDAFYDVTNNCELHTCNMIILRKDWHDKYWLLMSGILSRFDNYFSMNEMKDSPFFDKLYNRIPGYMAELITSIFISKHFKNSSNSIKVAINEVNY
ncbi:DUF4422 domain-containing protein [Polaribacter sp.]|nr:DUF4422 domain-containing protein [Polaribacter sp.]